MESLGFDESTVRVCHQGNIDYIANSGIHASDIDTVRAPLRPRSMYATPIDYKKIQPNFCYMPIQRVIDILTHTTQNMVLPESSFLRKRYRSQWPYMNLPRRFKYDSTDLICQRQLSYHWYFACPSFYWQYLKGYGCLWSKRRISGWILISFSRTSHQKGSSKETCCR